VTLKGGVSAHPDERDTGGVRQPAGPARGALCPALQATGGQDVTNYSFMLSVLHTLTHVCTSESLVHEVHGGAPVQQLARSDRKLSSDHLVVSHFSWPV
jgi:hypothetical protein